MKPHLEKLRKKIPIQYLENGQGKISPPLAGGISLMSLVEKYEKGENIKEKRRKGKEKEKMGSKR